MTRMNYSLSHNRDLTVRLSNDNDRIRVSNLRQAKRISGFPAKFDGVCRNCHAPFIRNTLIVLTSGRKPVHHGGCPKK